MKCVWCLKSSPETTFNRKAHIIPQSLGGKEICNNVCDHCNHYFGSSHDGKPSVEVVLKEVLNVSRYILLKQTNSTPRNFSRFKSTYFNVDWEKYIVKTKLQYGSKVDFQRVLCRQFKRGLYKVYLEARMSVIGDGFNERFDFIRSFARFDDDDLPVFYFNKAKDLTFFQIDDVLHPVLRFAPYHLDVIERYGMYELLIMGHYFSLPVLPGDLRTMAQRYLHEHLSANFSGIYESVTEITAVEDMDFTYARRY